MSQQDSLDDPLERLERDDERPQRDLSRALRFTRRAALSGGAAGLAAALLEACGSASGAGAVGTGQASGQIAAGIFDNDERLHFTIVNHLSRSPVFTPTQYGAADACRLLGCTFRWTGSATASTTEMVSAIDTAVEERVDGIATTLIDQTAFDIPVQNALDVGIPVISYNADIATNPRMAYIGENLIVSGRYLANQILEALNGPADIGIFIATPGSADLEPRVAGARGKLQTAARINFKVVGSGTTIAAQVAAVEAFVQAHPTFRGFFGVDGGSTQAIATVIEKLDIRGVVAGGFDITPVTAQALKAGYLQFAIDQQLYLQGFLPILQLYLYNVSNKLTGIANVDTGIKLVKQRTAAAYADTTSRYEGSAAAPGVLKR